jgi:pentatricopeptide repeat protein
MYDELSVPQCARKVFDEMSQRDTVSWNAIIGCYSQNGLYVQSLELFREMYISGFVPNPELIAGVLSICDQTDQLKLGSNFFYFSLFSLTMHID